MNNLKTKNCSYYCIGRCLSVDRIYQCLECPLKLDGINCQLSCVRNLSLDCRQAKCRRTVDKENCNCFIFGCPKLKKSIFNKESRINRAKTDKYMRNLPNPLAKKVWLQRSIKNSLNINNNSYITIKKFAFALIILLGLTILFCGFIWCLNDKNNSKACSHCKRTLNNNKNLKLLRIDDF